MEQQKDKEQKQFTDIGRNLASQHNPIDAGVPRHNMVHCSVTIGDSRSPRSFDYVVHKTEKLTTALYLVTDIMAEKEPMKWKARESAVDLLSDITLMSSLSVSEKMTMLRNTMKKTEKIIAFLDIARSAHLMSEMNASVLKKEYCALKDNLEEEWNHVYEKSKSIFSDSFFDVPHVPASNLPKGDMAYNSRGKPLRSLQSQSADMNPSSAPVLTARAPLPAGANTHAGKPVSADTAGERKISSFSNHNNSAQVSSGKSSGSEVPELPSSGVVEKKEFLPVNRSNSVEGTSIQANAPVVRPPHPPIGQTDHRALGVRSSTSTPQNVLLAQGRESFLREQNEASRTTVHNRHGEAHGFTQDGFGRDDRRKIILALIKQKPALTVKDIARSIPHVSEKTIQRELFSMVAEGTLRKRGERRWSMYSLCQRQ